MIKYATKQDRRTFSEKHATPIFIVIGLAAAIAFNSFHNRTKQTRQHFGLENKHTPRITGNKR